MKSFRLKKGVTGILIILLLMGLADFYLAPRFSSENQEVQKESPASDFIEEVSPVSSDETFVAEKEMPAAKPELKKNNFPEALKECAPEIAAQAVGTPEALLEYLKKSVGVEKEETAVENFHLTLPDGSLRRIHVITADNTNSVQKKELRFFKLDTEGYPERLSLKGHETLQSLLGLGTVTKHEAKIQYLFKDGGSAHTEIHGQTVFEIQYNNIGKILSCRFSECQCDLENRK